METLILPDYRKVSKEKVISKNLLIKEELIEAIKSQHKSVLCLSELCNLTKQSIYNVIDERTTLNCTINTLQSLALALGYEVVLQKRKYRILNY